MAKTVTQLTALVREYTDHNSPDLYSDAQILELLNNTYMEIWQMFEWEVGYKRVTLQTVSGDTEVALPADVRRVAVVTNKTTQNWYQLEQQEPVPYDWDASTGKPLEFYVENGNLVLYPEPSSVYDLEVRYYCEPDVLSGGSDTPLFPDEFHIGLAYGAASDLLIMAGSDESTAAYYRTKFESILTRMRESTTNLVSRPVLLGRRGRINRYRRG